MDSLYSLIDQSEYLQSPSDLLIHEISKPPRPFDNEKLHQKIPLKYKNPEVRKII